MNISEILNRAFEHGEAKGIESQRRAVELYLSIVAKHPTLYDAWFNLGVVSTRVGLNEDAIECYKRAEESSELRILAAFARLMVMMNLGLEPENSDFPPEFRGEKRGVLGVLGPCYNVATLFRNSGWQCRVEQSESGAEACSIFTNFANQEYIIHVQDVFGTLVKNTYKKVGGNEIRLSPEIALSDADRAVMTVPVGTLELLQIKAHG